MKTLLAFIALLVATPAMAGVTTTIEVYQGGSDFAVGRWVSLASINQDTQQPSCGCFDLGITGYQWRCSYWSSEGCGIGSQSVSEPTLAWSCVDIPDPGRGFKIIAHPSTNCWTVEECSY